jgi:hypothetical protein
MQCIAAALAWVLKDGVGMIASILFASSCSTFFSVYMKEWWVGGSLYAHTHTHTHTHCLFLLAPHWRECVLLLLICVCIYMYVREGVYSRMSSMTLDSCSICSLQQCPVTGTWRCSHCRPFAKVSTNEFLFSCAHNPLCLIIN